MSGTKKDRKSLKNRFKKGMYPTEDDFAAVLESYVHKDDTIEMSKVVLKEGGETVSEVIDKKADKRTLDAFIEEVDTVLETVRDAETGEITKTVIQDLSKRIKDAEDDIADTSNTAEKNENAIAKILSILGKQDGETVSELAARFTALSGDYATVYAFISKVKAFLESADVADTTINRWQEIENFLQGITDKETLTGLLEHLKTEIKNEIPKGNFLEQVADLDGYTDAEDGKIVQYIGQTNDKYTRGYCYERKSKEDVVINDWYIEIPPDNRQGIEETGIYVITNEPEITLNLKYVFRSLEFQFYAQPEITIGSKIAGYEGVFIVKSIENDNVTISNGVKDYTFKWSNMRDDGGSRYKKYEKVGDPNTFIYYNNGYNYMPLESNGIKSVYNRTFEDTTKSQSCSFPDYSTGRPSTTIQGEKTWQHIPVSPVIY